MRTGLWSSAMSLKARIAIFTVVLFVCAIWALAHDLDREVRGSFKDVLAAQQFQTVEHVATTLDAAVKIRIGALSDVAGVVDAGRIADPDYLHGFLAERVSLYRFFNTGLVVVSADGKGIADVPNLKGREGADFAGRDFFQDVIATGQPVVGKPIIGRFTKAPVVSIGVPIINRDKQVVAVLVGGNTIASGDFLGEVKATEARGRGEFYVISSKDGLIIASTKSERIMQPDPVPGANTMYDRYRAGYEGSGIGINSHGVETLTSAKRVPSTGWMVIASLPTSVAFAPLQDLEREIYKDAGIASLVIIVLLWVFLHHQLSPLSRSAMTIEAMAGGKQPLRLLKPEGSIEIRRLLDGFNKFQQHIRRQHEEEQRAREVASRAEERSRMKSEFLANMSHELRTPLNAIIGFSDAMGSQMFGRLEAKYLEYAADIRRSGLHLLELINDVLDVSAIEADRVTLHDEIVNVGVAVDESMALIRQRADREGIALSVAVAPEAIRVRADDRRFRQILINLLTNAIKFTPAGGSVGVDVRVCDGRLTVSVTDSGIGMDADGIAVALSRFGQVESSYTRTQQGTGLGLPLSKRLAELHGGGLSIDSTPGSGTSVVFWLGAERTVEMAQSGEMWG